MDWDDDARWTTRQRARSKAWRVQENAAKIAQIARALNEARASLRKARGIMRNTELTGDVGQDASQAVRSALEAIGAAESALQRELRNSR